MKRGKPKLPEMMPEDVMLFEAIKKEIDQNERKITRNMRVIIVALIINLAGTAYVAYRLYHGLLNAWG